MQNGITRSPRRAAGFTLVELLVVIGIIVLLISILVPVVSRVRIAGQNASATSFVNQIARAIDAYEIDFRAYPGPFTNTEIYNSNGPLLASVLVDPDPTISSEYATTPFDTTKITMAENLVLGLLGGLRRDSSPPNRIMYDPRLIGGGAYSLNPSGGVAKRHKAYVEATNLSWRVTESPLDSPSPPDRKTGQYRDAAGKADDSIIPEFVDTYPDPMPILYLRAKRGATAKSGMPLDAKNNTIITFNLADPNDRVGQYDLHQILAYTTPVAGNRPIGVGRSQIKSVGWGATAPVHGLSATGSPPIDIKSTMQPYDPMPPGATHKYPFDAYAYFRNQSLSTPRESDDTNYGSGLNRNDVPHQKDGYILISAGADRLYGTRDDITNFGPVGQ